MAATRCSVAYLCLQATRQGQASHAHVHEIIAGLRRRGWDVTLIEPSYAAEGARVPGAVGRFLEFGRVRRRFRVVAADSGVAYIRAHFAAAPAARWAKRRGVLVVQEVNGPYDDLFTAWPFTRRFRWYFTRLMRQQYRDADALIAVSQRLAEWLQVESGNADITVIPNGANTEIFTPDAEPRRGLPERYVAFFGALAAWQGIETMLAALDEPVWPEDLALVVAGDGQARRLVEGAAARDRRVVYIGTLPYSEVPGLVTGSIAGLSPKSRVGGAADYASPVKPFEILACGRPAVVTDFPGQADFVRQHRCGTVVPPEDPAALAAAVAQLAGDPARAVAMGCRGRAAVVAEASWEARALATEAVIQRVLARNGSSTCPRQVRPG